MTPERLEELRVWFNAGFSIGETATDDELNELLTAVEEAGRLRKSVAVLARIADAYDDNALDDEARKFWGKNDEHTNKRPPSTIELYAGRGGRQLLTLQDCLDARAALESKA